MSKLDEGGVAVSSEAGVAVISEYGVADNGVLLLLLMRLSEPAL